MHFLSVWEWDAAVWPAAVHWSVGPRLLPLNGLLACRSGLLSLRRNFRGNRETEVVSGKQSEVSVSGQFQFH